MKTIVSMTSWKGRIQNTRKVIQSLNENTVKADKIILNLSTDEFLNKENDLPIDLVEMSKIGIYEIYWVKENTNLFKKIIPTIQRYFNEPEYVLFSCDDDWLYGKTYIEQMLEQLGNKNSFCASKHKLIGNRICYNSRCFDERLWLGLTNEIINFRNDDAYLDVYFQLKKTELSNAPLKSIIDEIVPFNQINPNGKINSGYTQKRIAMAYELSRKSLKRFFS